MRTPTITPKASGTVPIGRSRLDRQRLRRIGEMVDGYRSSESWAVTTHRVMMIGLIPCVALGLMGVALGAMGEREARIGDFIIIDGVAAVRSVIAVFVPAIFILLAITLQQMWSNITAVGKTTSGAYWHMLTRNAKFVLGATLLSALIALIISDHSVMSTLAVITVCGIAALGAALGPELLRTFWRASTEPGTPDGAPPFQTKIWMVSAAIFTFSYGLLHLADSSVGMLALIAMSCGASGAAGLINGAWSVLALSRRFDHRLAMILAGHEDTTVVRGPETVTVTQIEQAWESSDALVKFDYRD